MAITDREFDYLKTAIADPTIAKSIKDYFEGTTAQTRSGAHTFSGAGSFTSTLNVTGLLTAQAGLTVAAAANDIVVIANTAAALEVSDGTTKILTVDTRNTVKNTAAVTIIPSPVTIASEAAVHTSSALSIPARTITYTGTNTVTSLLGVGLNIGAPTVTNAMAQTVTRVSSLHVDAIAAAGGMVTITTSHMISTSVSGAFLTNAGVWTDMACWESGKNDVALAEPNAIDNVIAQIQPRSWTYKPEVHGNDHGIQRVGVMYDDLPSELMAPGYSENGDRAVSTGVLSSFALAAIKRLSDRIDAVEKKKK